MLDMMYIDQSPLSSKHATAWLFLFLFLLVDFVLFLTGSLRLTIARVESKPDGLIKHLLQTLLGQGRALEIFALLIREDLFGLELI
jgi:hypothetical protein